MELKTLEYFLTIAQKQNITKAADVLHVSQPSLSLQMKNLESELGKTLLLRGTKGAKNTTLTDEGRILRNRATEILKLVQKTKAEIEYASDIVSGNVYLSIAETSLTCYLATAGKLLREKYPGIKIHIQSGTAIFVQDQIDNGLADFGLTFALNLDKKKYNVLPVPGANIWGLLIRKDSPLANHKDISPNDLATEPLIIPERMLTNNELTHWLGVKPDQLNLVGTCTLFYNAAILAETGIGSVIVLDSMLKNTGDDSPLKFLPFSPRLEARTLIYYEKYKHMSRAAQKYLEFLKLTLDQVKI